MDAIVTAAAKGGEAKPFYAHLYVQVLFAIVFGVCLGHFYPAAGEAMKPLGDGFIKLIKMLIAPIIFVTVVHGIASMGDLRKVGRVGVKALLYFEIVTTLALAIGLTVGNVLQPGAGMHVDVGSLDTSAIAGMSPNRMNRRRSGSYSTSFRTRFSALLRKAISCRCC
jgi:aerobic C4-dicarboxylate transport protein